VVTGVIDLWPNAACPARCHRNAASRQGCATPPCGRRAGREGRARQRARIAEVYGASLSKDTVSVITGKVLAEMTE
jgi:hypothetical protein